MKKLMTTKGTLGIAEVGWILPHEHIFVDLREMDVEGFGIADVEDVKKVMVPELKALKEAGGTVLIECTPLGVGRRVDLIKAVSDSADFPVIVPTGIYREPWVPLWAYEAEQSDLEAWMTRELTVEIEHTGKRAGFIKLSAGDDGMTKVEEKILRAACESAKPLDVAIGSHTVKGWVVRNQLDIVEEMGYSADRFIWIHAHQEMDFELHLELAKRGCWIEYDGIGWDDDRMFIDRIVKMIEAGYEEQLLISQDRGWYDPACDNGGSPKPYTYLYEVFIPKLKAAGLSDELIDKLLRKNPFKAFSRMIIE